MPRVPYTHSLVTPHTPVTGAPPAMFSQSKCLPKVLAVRTTRGRRPTHVTCEGSVHRFLLTQADAGVQRPMKCDLPTPESHLLSCHAASLVEWPVRSKARQAAGGKPQLTGRGLQRCSGVPHDSPRRGTCAPSFGFRRKYKGSPIFST